ncbi:MAG: STAS domain-containing protein [Planctomycetota bacterium]
MSDTLRFNISDFPGALAVKLLRIHGSIDARSVGGFQHDIEGRIADGMRRMVFDMREVSYVNSTGLGYLVRLSDQLRDLNGLLLLVGVQPTVQTVFDMLGMGSLFDIVDDMEQAGAWIASRLSDPAASLDAERDRDSERSSSDRNRSADASRSGSASRRRRLAEDASPDEVEAALGMELGSTPPRPDSAKGAASGGSRGMPAPAAKDSVYESDEFTPAGGAAPPPPPPPPAPAPAQQQQTARRAAAPPPQSAAAPSPAPPPPPPAPVVAAPAPDIAHAMPIPVSMPAAAAADDATPIAQEEEMAAAAAEDDGDGEMGGMLDDANPDSFDQLDAAAAYLELERRQRTESVKKKAKEAEAPGEAARGRAAKRSVARKTSGSMAKADIDSRIARASERHKTTAAPAKTALAAQAVAAAPVEKLADLAAGDTIERQTTVRYYEQMNPLRNFPLLVLLTKEKVEKIVMKHVAQTEGVGVKIKAANPMVEIVPRVPGCLVVPDRLTVDVRPESVEAQFFVTPLAPGDIRHARVEIWYEGVRIDTIETPTKVTTQFIARVLALGGVLNPLIFGTLEGLGVNPSEAASNAMLVRLAQNFGGSYMVMGLAAAVVCGLLASLFWWINKPRQSDPVVQFMNWTGQQQEPRA